MSMRMEKKELLSVWVFCRVFVSFVLTELCFGLCAFGSSFLSGVYRHLIFSACFALVMSVVLLPLGQKARRIVSDVVTVLFAAYGFFQLEFHNFMGTYLSFQQAGEAGQVMQFAGTFFSSMKPVYLLLFAIPVITGIVFRKWEDAVPSCRIGISSFMAVLLSVSLFISGYSSDVNRAIPEQSLKAYGLDGFLMMDLNPMESDSETVLVTEESEVEESAAPEVKTRASDLDDSVWAAYAQEETDLTMKQIDAYLRARPITDYNEYTGMMQDWNVIYIMIEALDYVAIDPELTPTLYKMMTEGWSFPNHYSPYFSCATGETEWVSELSLVPMSDMCTPDEYMNNDLNSSIFTLFSNAGYYTSAYHDWQDEFYQRRVIYSNSGCRLYMNYDDVEYEDVTDKWPSDYEMMEKTVDNWIHKDQFFTLYVTVSTHFPYDQETVLSERYLEEVQAVHPEYPWMIKRYLSKAMELDKGMEYLLERLEEEGRADDTVIVFFADHHPISMNEDIIEYGSAYVDRSEPNAIDKTPFVIYNKNLKAEEFTGINSSFDILPTIANLTNIAYDPRIYVGKDYFSDEEKMVLFANGDWAVEEGMYIAAEESFSGNLSEEEIKAYNIRYENLFTISDMIYTSDYFHYRKGISTPVYLTDQ